MIGVENKLIITRQINKVLVTFAYRLKSDLLYQIAFDRDNVSELLQTIQHEYLGSSSLSLDTDEEVTQLILKYLKALNEEELTAYYFLIFNDTTFLEDDVEEEQDNISDDLFERKLGRKIAYQLYEPESSGLHSQLIALLKIDICNFSAELDLSEIDEDTIITIKETIGWYSKPIHRF